MATRAAKELLSNAAISRECNRQSKVEIHPKGRLYKVLAEGWYKLSNEDGNTKSSE